MRSFITVSRVKFPATYVVPFWNPGCTCVLMRVGITDLPARSMTRAPAPARALISAEVPTATMSPPPMAMASATVLRPSTVMTVPSINTRST